MKNKIIEQYYLYKAGKLDVEAFGKVYDIYLDKIYRYVYFKVSSVQEAQDISSDVFLKAWEYVQNNKVENLEALLYRMARNLVIDFYRKDEKHTVTDIESVSEYKLSEHRSVDINARLDIRMQSEKVFEAMQELNDSYREVIILKYVDQLSIKEIASVIDKSNGATRVLVHRALTVLKKILEQKRREQ